MINYSNLIKDNNYSSVELVMASEVVRLLVCTVLSLNTKDENGGSRNIYWLVKVVLGGKKMIVLVIMCVINNLIGFQAITRIGAPTFTESQPP